MRLTICAACLAFSLPAAADIGPDDLWQRWQSGDGAVAAIEGSARSEGGGLVVGGAVLRLGQDDAAPRLHAEELRIVAEGAATRVSLPDRWRIEGGDGTTAEMTVEDFEVRVSGSIAAPEYRVRKDRLAASATVTSPEGSVDATLDAVAFNLGVGAGGSGDLSADTMSLTATPRDEDQGRISVSYEDLSASLVQGTASGEAASGTSVSLTTAAAASTQSFTAPLEAGGPPATIDIVSGPSRGEVLVGGGRMDARQTASGLTLSAAGEEVPLPDARIEIDALTLALGTPAEPVSESAPVSVDLGLTGVKPSEQIWQLLDPGADLPRDPAELRLSVTGAMFWKMAEGLPVPALERVSLDTFRISALGAEIGAEGGVQFSPPATPERPGKPIGAVVFSLSGFGALLDKLATLDTLPKGQIIGLRMGLGVLTMPAEGKDALRAEVEFAPDGVIVINGAPVARIP